MKVAIALSALLCATNANVVLYHRVSHPTYPDLKYLKRGVISGHPPTLSSSDSLINDIKTLSEALSDLGDPFDVLYQVALAPEESNSPERVDFSSVKVVCFPVFASCAHFFTLNLVPLESSYCRDLYSARK